MKSQSDLFPDEDLPPALLADLRAMQRSPAVPPAIDQQVVSSARSYFARQRRVRLWVRIAGSLAATILVVIGIRLAMRPDGLPTQVVQHEAPPAAYDASTVRGANTRPAPPTALVDPDILRRDIDLNGKVDILDAFVVARCIKQQQTRSAWDVTGDGAVDGQDVDQIAAAAVAVKGGVQ